jgi:hypothetical protein
MTLYTHQTIHLAEDEWGNTLMQEIAESAIAEWRGPGELVVEVYEHAGWFLTFARINGRIACVSSANDCARFDQQIRQFWSDYNSAYKWLKVDYAPSVRREKKEKVAA